VLLFAFFLLQAMDAVTTAVFLYLGVMEGNPLIRLALARSAGDVLGSLLALAVPKLLAVALGVFAWRSGRKRLLLQMDILFALSVAWNTAVIFRSL
jgi:hypothetical protein